MTTAIITGFTTHTPVMLRSFAPLVALRRTGAIDRIVYVTWDTEAIDAYVAPALEWPEVEVVRLPQPEVSGLSHWRGFVYQSRNLDAALKLVGNPGELVFKTRPDFLIDEAFLASKIASFERWSVAPDFSGRIPVVMPPSPFLARIWVPWADASAPFYFEDAAFMGLACDLGRLVNPLAEELVMVCGDETSINIAHVLRFAMPFLGDWPIFKRYLRDFHLFRMEQRYREKLAPLSAGDVYFLHLALANAWILNSSFHVDCGTDGQMRLIGSDSARKHRDWPVDKINDHVIYKDVETWRKLEKAGSFLPILFHAAGRLVDDEWQYRLFAGPVEHGVTDDNLRLMLENLNRYDSGLLGGLERAYYAAVEALYCRFSRNAA